MAAKDFLRATAKISIAIVVAVLILCVVGGIVWKVIDYRTKEEEGKFQISKDWSYDVKQNLGMQLVARTKLVDGTMYMSVRFDGYPAYLSDPVAYEKNRDGFISIQFMDDDGFKVYEKSVKIREMNSMVDPMGKKIGLNHQFDEFVGVDRYKRFTSMRIMWNLDTDAAAIAAPPKAAIVKPSLNDHCAPNISRGERLNRLAQHGLVRQTGMGEYAVGGRSFTVLSDGELLSCR